MEHLRRVPLPLVIAFALDAALSITLFVAPELWREHGILPALYAGRLASAALVPVGLFLLARRSTGSVQRGAIVAAIGGVAAVALDLAMMVFRTDALDTISLVVTATIAVGYAGMASRRAMPLAVVELVVVVGGHWLVRLAPHELSFVLALAATVVELAIVALVSPPRPDAADSGLRRPDRAKQIATVAALLYVASLVVPAVRITGFALVGAPKEETWFGVSCLMFGWIVFPGWLPNPLLGVGALLLGLKKPRAALVLGCFAIAFAIVAAVILVSGNLGVKAILVGYWLWLASTIAFTIAAYIRVLERREARWATT